MAVFVIVLTLVLGFLARPEGGINNTTKDGEKEVVNKESPLVTDLSHYDFGTIKMKDGKVSKRFSFTNTGRNTPVVLDKLYTSCMCTEATLFLAGSSFGPFGMPGHGSIRSLGLEMKEESLGEIEVVFDPAAHGPSGVGKITRDIRLEVKDGKPLELSFTANVTP